MTNEEKAKEICCTQGCRGFDFCVKTYGNPCDVYTNCIKTAEWKDQQFAEEKKQWIEKAYEWLNNNAGGYLDYEAAKYGESVELDKESLLEDFKYAMGE